MLTPFANAEERSVSFDKDPQWESHNNRLGQTGHRNIHQDFGYRPPKLNEQGAVGGFITPCNEPAYYAKRIPNCDLNTPLTASGIVECTGRKFNVLIGFFNKDTLGGWRTPNTLALRLYGRGEVFYAYLEYANKLGRAGADSPQGFNRKGSVTGKTSPILFQRKELLRWSIRYNPEANEGKGAIYARIGEHEAVCDLGVGHRQEGATFNRFGFLNVMKSADDGDELWLHEAEVNGIKDLFERDPKWEGYHNRRDYATADIRPRFNFGYSNYQIAGGAKKGEIGGLVFRGDARYANSLATYGDRLEPLTLDHPLKASGKITLVRAVSDSTTLFGFFHSVRSHRVMENVRSGFPNNFLGVAIEGPSSEGFFAYPAIRFDSEGTYASYSSSPRIYPDSRSHTWTLEYQPREAGRGLILFTLDNKTVTLEITRPSAGSPTQFDRFGIISTCIDGNAQYVYWDDLNYTFRQ